MGVRKGLFFFCALLLFSFKLFSQEKREAQDSLIRLVEAESAQLVEENGVSYRKVVGPARFLHNNTYLLCDTALWNVNENVIKAVGNVQIIQESTFLTSDRIDYIVDDNLAKFRGTLVELYDKDGNVLRTNYLDYNTRDSIGTFFNGGAMRSSTGSVIESKEGWYFAYDKLFSFEENVQMFTDSVFIRSKKIEYSTADNKAYFGRTTIAWQEDNMLFANDGMFDRDKNSFHFYKDSYVMTKDQELWADTLSYYRNSGEAALSKNIQILDEGQSSMAFADKGYFRQYPFFVSLTEKPAVGVYGVENGVKDTMFVAADTLRYYHLRYCDIDSAQIAMAKQRVQLSNLDPLIDIEAQSEKKRVDNKEFSNFITPKKRAEEREEEQVDNSSSVAVVDSSSVAIDSLAAGAGSLVVGVDSLAVGTDSLNVGVDSLAISADSVSIVQVDTTAVVFVDAWNNVKVYRNNLQALCDSLVYTGLDSMARLYVNPVMWSDVKHQLSADSMQLVIKDNVLSKANLITNAFIASQEDTLHYNQIKGTEMVAYFNENDVCRFDALGGASMIFYIAENDVYTIMNQKEGKIISARLRDREIQRIKYVESLKNDAYPVFNLPIENQRLKGFNWRGDERPHSRYDLLDRKIKKSERENIKRRSFPDYPITKLYFPAEREEILAYKRKSDSLRREKALAELMSKEAADRDSLMRSDSLGSENFDIVKEHAEAENDSLENMAMMQDSSDIAGSDKVIDSTLTAKEKRALERERKRIEKQEKRTQAKLERKKRREQRLLAAEEKRKERREKKRGSH